jgi:acetylornithine deacetylase/succinyl-diaminopimelate desuccinylase-like protein
MGTVLMPRQARRQIAACVHLALASLLAAAPLHAAEAPSAPPANVALARDILQQLIGMASVHSTGSTVAAQAMAQRLRDGGFAADDVQVLVPADQPTYGNVVVRLRGKGKDKPLLYLGHLDVVEAKREDWNFDPFKLTESDGWLYGRGTIDMLGQDSAMVASLIRMKQEGYVPERGIILALTANEEAGAVGNGVDFLLKNHRALIDAGLAINPDGGEAALKNGRTLYLAVQTSEKRYMTFGLEVTDKGGHSSRPTKANPIYKLARGLEKISAYEFPAHLTETTRLYFSGRAPMESGRIKAAMLDVGGAKPSTGAQRRLSAEVETNIVLRTTCTATGIEGGHAENALPQRARATIQCRAIPGESVEDVEGRLRKAINDPEVKITRGTMGLPAPESPPTQAILTAVKRVTGSMWPGVAIIPNMSPGASDSIYTRAAGIPTYGVDAMFDDLDDGRAHGRDERISVKGFGQEVEFTYRLMKELSGPR